MRLFNFANTKALYQQTTGALSTSLILAEKRYNVNLILLNLSDSSTIEVVITMIVHFSPD